MNAVTALSERSAPFPLRYVSVECLNCGEVRRATCGPDLRMHAGECRRCGDVGWARPADLTERDRHALLGRLPASPAF